MTAVEWLVSQLNKQEFTQVVTDEEIQHAKEMEKKQMEEKDSIIGEIDFELSMIEDYAHGEVGNTITNVRHKIQQYYKTTHGK